MIKESTAVADFQRKPYAKPQMKVAVINEADIICTSETATFSLGEDQGYDEDEW